MIDINLTLEKIVMIDRPADRKRAPLHGLMNYVGLKPSIDEVELTAKGFDVTTASVITEEVLSSVRTAEHVFLPFTTDAGSDLGKLQTALLLTRRALANEEFDYAYFGPPPGATS